ncbi:MAG TPA: pectinesterase family protein [Ktedonobacteraceae bacterium]|nr:pectinesterase family protein [Ktedonobacteraceae bacterium]
MLRSLQPAHARFHRYGSLLLFVLLVTLFAVIFAGRTPAHAAYSLLVAKDGTGNYTTVQAAINAVAANNNQHVVIYIKNGVYSEVVTVPSNKPHITLFGQSSGSTIITFNNYSGKAKPDGTLYGTGDSATVLVSAPDFTAINVTFENSHGSGAQAVAIRVNGDRAVFYNCHFLGYQDTLYADNLGRQYYVNSYIRGAVDFIFGNATAVFDTVEVHTVGTGYITAQSRTSSSQTSGYVFTNSKLTTDSTSYKTFLGRPWRPYSRVVYLNTSMAGHITPAGWDNWGNTANEATAYYAEYNSSGAGANASARVSWSHQLTSSQAGAYSTTNFLNQDGWLTTAMNYVNSLLALGFQS